MTRTWKLWGLSTLTTFVLAARAFAGGAGDGPPADPDPLKRLEKRVDEIAAKGKGLADQMNKAFEKFGEDLKAIHRRLKALEEKDADSGLKLTDAELKLLKYKESIHNLRKVVNQLREDLETLQKRLPAGDVSKYPPGDKVTLDDILTRLQRLEQDVARLKAGGAERTVRAAPSTGRVVFANRHPQELLFILNNVSHRVLPNQTLTFNAVPSGNFTYEVIADGSGTGGRQARVLGTGETFTITAR